MRSRRRLSLLAGLTLSMAALVGPTPVLASSLVPLAVSPGSAEGTLIGDICPTFSWGEVDAATSYELVVYATEDGIDRVEPLLSETFPGSVESWTPSLDRCLDWGGRYAWSVRAVGGPGAGWSETLLFRVAPSSKYSSQIVRSQSPREEAGPPQAFGEVASPPHPPIAILGPATNLEQRAPQPALPSTPSLTIDGDMVLGGSIHHQTPRIGKVQLSAADFVPTGDNSGISREEVYIYVKNTSPQISLIAGVHSIPAGALIIDFECRVTDNSTTEQVRCSLWHTDTDLGYSSQWYMETTYPGTDPDPQTISPTGAEPSIFTAHERWWVEFEPSSPTCHHSCVFYWATITYLVHELD